MVHYHFHEEQLIPRLPESKCVDLVVLEEEGILFIDAKGVEMADIAKSAHHPRVIKDRTKKTILKAIEQAHAVYGNIGQLGELFQIDESSDEPFVIVVTYKEHFLGNGVRFADSIASDAIDKLQANCLDAQIPLENIYFLTVDDFDFLAQAVKEGKTTFVSALKDAREADSDPKTLQFNFTLHLSRLGFRTKADWLREAGESLVERMERCFPGASDSTSE